MAHPSPTVPVPKETEEVSEGKRGRSSICGCVSAMNSDLNSDLSFPFTVLRLASESEAERAAREEMIHRVLLRDEYNLLQVAVPASVLSMLPEKDWGGAPPKFADVLAAKVRELGAAQIQARLANDDIADILALCANKPSIFAQFCQGTSCFPFFFCI